MTVNSSNESHNNGLLNTLRRSLTLRRHSQNKFSPDFENNLQTNKANLILKKTTFNRSLSDTAKNPQPRNWTQTLERRGPTFLQEFLPNSLEQARMRFSDDSNDKGPDAPKEKKHLNLRRSSIFLGTLKKNVNALLINLKTPEEIDAYLQKAKNLFQSSGYKESKKLFKDLLGSKHLDALEKKPEIGLYLAALYLLEKKGSKVNEYLKGSSFLKIVIGQHAKHLLDPKQQDVPFPKADFYDTVVKTGSEDEKIVSEKLFEVFGIKTPPQDIQ